MQEAKSAKRVIQILELLSKAPDAMSLKEISDSLGIPPSTSLILLRTLTAAGYVLREEASRTYRLGAKLFELVAYTDGLDVVQVANPVMEYMNRISKEAVSLAILEDTDVVFIHKKTSSGPIRIVNDVGTRLPAHATALGKAILSQLPAEHLDTLYPNDELAPCTPRTIISKRSLQEHLGRVRQTGTAYDAEESRNGVSAIGAPIKGRDGSPVAAISIGLLATPEQHARPWRRLGALVKAGAAVVSARLGYASSEAAAHLSLSYILSVWETETAEDSVNDDHRVSWLEC